MIKQFFKKRKLISKAKDHEAKGNAYHTLAAQLHQQVYKLGTYNHPHVKHNIKVLTQVGNDHYKQAATLRKEAQ